MPQVTFNISAQLAAELQALAQRRNFPSAKAMIVAWMKHRIRQERLQLRRESWVKDGKTMDKEEMAKEVEVNE